jgi:outer membrane protein TolC
MKKFTALSSLFLILFALQVSAQESIIGDINYNTLEKYIMAAKENFPRKKILETRAEGIKTAITINNLSYLDLFNASYFYRPDKQAVLVTPGSTTASPYSVNGFQFGATINLGTYLAKPWVGKRAKAEYKVAQLEVQEYNTTLALEVKRRYYAYVQQMAQLKINAQSVQDNKNVADNMKNRFERGEITLDTYNQSRINLASANSAKIQSEVSYLSAKDALEEVIGKPLSEIK